MSTTALRDPPLPAVELSPRTRRVLDALCEVLVPPEPPVPGYQAAVAGFVAMMVPYLPPMTRRLLPLGLWLFSWGTVLFLFAAVPFWRLSLEARRRYVRSWQHSRLSLRRQLIKGLKALVLMGYYEIPAAQAHVGYHPEPFVAGLVRRRAELVARSGGGVVDEPHAAAADGAGGLP